MTAARFVASCVNETGAPLRIAYEDLPQNVPPIGVADVQQAMRDVAQSNTLHMMLFEPEPLKLHLAIGPADTPKPLVTLELAELFRHEASTAE